MKKKYVTEVVGYDFLEWKNNKIIIKAPTGSGKTTFVVKFLLKYYQKRGIKLLILCNRKLLRLQYWYSVIQNFESYEELVDTVDVKTYQELAGDLMNGNSAESLLKGYAGVVLDEVHFFYADSDFNGFGTYVLLQALIKAGVSRQMIFMSATIDCIEPWLRKIINQHMLSLPLDGNRERMEKDDFYMRKYDLNVPEQYDHINCLAVQDMESLAEIFATSTKKGVIFMDNIKKAEALAELLQKRGVQKSAITCLNAENLDTSENQPVVKTLAMANRVESKIVITTSVLDNGVSIHDQEVENVSIITESKISFLQMLGRVRVESTHNLNLYFLVREAEEFEKKEKELEVLLKFFDGHNHRGVYHRRLQILNSMCSNSDELADVWRKVFVIEPSFVDVLQERGTINISYGDTNLAVNLFAKAKVGDLYITEAKFHQMAIVNPLNVIHEQMRWIDKSPEELQVLSSTYAEEQTAALRQLFLSIQNFTNEQLVAIKEEIANGFGKDILKKYGLRQRSFSTEVFKGILEEYGMKLSECMVDRKKRYSVVCIAEEEGL